MMSRCKATPLVTATRGSRNSPSHSASLSSLLRTWSRPLSSQPFPPTPSFPQYRQLKNDLLASLEPDQSLMRLDCMKPATALAHYLKPIPLCRPPFTHSYEHVTSQVKSIWGSLADLSPDHMVLTKGVRDGLYIVLEALSQGGTTNAVFSPEDVYPVYEKIVGKTSSSSIVKQFSTLHCMDLPTVLAEASQTNLGEEVNTVLLLPHPITPLGRFFTTEETDQLMAWLTNERANPRYLVLDCVYSFDPSADNARLASLLKLPNVVALHSLAKGWISPFLEPLVVSLSNDVVKAVEPAARSNFSNGVGFAFTSSSVWRRLVQDKCIEKDLQPSHSACQQAHHILQQQPKLPQQLGRRIALQWQRLLPRLCNIEPSFVAPHSGYFTTLLGQYGDIYNQHKAITVPASVFGAPLPLNRSVVSCLYDIKDEDFAEKGSVHYSRPALDVTPMYHVTTLSNFIKGYDKYSRRYCKSTIPESTFPDQFFLLHSHQLMTGIDKATKLLRKLDIKNDCLLILHTEVNTPARPQEEQEEATLLHPHPKGQFLKRNWITITDLSVLPDSPSATLEGISVEEAAARSLHLQNHSLQSYKHVRPRSVSILPIAKGCQAKCPFCFSKGSVSSDIKQQRMYEDGIERVLAAAQARGAERAVITGGGEPFMLPFSRLLKIITQCSARFKTVCAITNGYEISRLDAFKRKEALNSLDKAGLSVLSISRHAVTEDDNESIMWLRTESQKVAESWREGMESNDFSSLTRLRWVCVLQKGGVDSIEKIHDYIAFVAQSGANEVCFKELYVSTSVESVYHNNDSNVWSMQNQIPLSLVLEFCEDNGFVKTSQLPWGAPIYEGSYHGKSIKIAAYTEPSVFWERSEGLCRSWNYMANGEILASLEDKDSKIDIASYIS